MLPDGSYELGHECPPDPDPEHPGLHHIDMPSAFHRDMRLPSLSQWALYGGIPNPLIAVALKVEADEFNYSESTEEDRQAFQDLVDVTVAGSFEPEVPVEYVRGYDAKGKRIPGLPKEDRDYAWKVCVRAIPVGGAKVALMEAMARFRGESDIPVVPPSVQRTPNRAQRRAKAV